MAQDRSQELEIHPGISIGVSEAGAWVVKAGDERFPLKDIDDFYRAWLLLQRPFVDAKAALDRITTGASAAGPFPIWMLVGSTLKAASTHWTDVAMTWLPYLTTMEKASLKNLLIETRDSRWASQKSRQMAGKYVNEIERYGQT